MSDVFYLRPIDPPATPEAVQEMAKHAGGCFKLHRVDWRQSFLAKDGTRMLCWYRAPDAESARLALRELGSDMNAVWAGRVAGEQTAAPSSVQQDCVVAEITPGPPRSHGELAALAESLTPSGTTLLRAFVSNAGNRLVCIYATSDAAAVQAGLPGGQLAAETVVWPAIAITPQLSH